MPLVLGIRYLTGYAVATDPTDRRRAEWPPHPARVFMAMAAACFETECDPAEAAALRWLEQLAPPQLIAAEADERTPVTAFVPVNDQPIGKKPGALQSTPGWRRWKQPRMFPRTRPQDDRVFLAWPDVDSSAHRSALQALCARVTRIGHSSSLVQMWVADDVPPAPVGDRWEPDDLEAEVRLRVVSVGALGDLEERFGHRARAEYQERVSRIEALGAERKSLKGAGARERKAALQQQLDDLAGQLPDVPPRGPLRPAMSLWKGYRRERRDSDPAVAGTIWDERLVVRRLERVEGAHDRLDLTAWFAVATAMHRAVIANAGESVADFISGHRSDGTPADRPHLAYLPMAFVGGLHGTGHVLGIGVAIPEELSREQRRAALAAIGGIEQLVLGRLGVWRLATSDSATLSLRADRWTGGAAGARRWATVTPIAFDRHARGKDRAEDDRELRRMIAEACGRIGLPEPVEVRLSPVARWRGSPACHEFPRLRRKDGSERRHAHAILEFDRPVRGPIAIGAGRFRGYGFCRPIGGEEGTR